MLGKSKIQNFAFSLGVGLLLSATGFAQGAAPATAQPANAQPQPLATGPSKVGIVRIQDAILSTNEGKKEVDALNQRFGERSNALRTRGEAFDKEKAALQAQSEKLNEDEKNSRVKKIADTQKGLQRDMEDFQAEVQQAEQEVINRVGEKMLKVLEKFARTNGYSMVLDVSNPQTPVLWASQGADITKELVDAYNTESPVSVPTAPKPAAGATTPGRPGAAVTRPPATSTTTPKKP